MAIQKPEPIPDQRAMYVQPDRTPNSDFFRWLQSVDRALRAVIDLAEVPPPALPDYEFEEIQEWPVVIEFPEDGADQDLSLKASVARTITEVVTKCKSGSCTVVLTIDGTPLGGSSNSVTTSEQSQSHSTANTWGVGQDVGVTISSNSSCEGLRITFKTTRTVAVTAVP